MSKAAPLAPSQLTRQQWSPLSYGAIWVLYFCATAAAALLFQKLILPSVSGLGANADGLLPNDARHFHIIAVAIASQIQEFGWSVWSLFPKGDATGSGNVAVLGALYALFGPDPSVIIPVNAALHATGGVLVILIAQKIWPGATGMWAGVLASVLFIAQPSALNWYAQLHKDGYAIVGYFLMVYGWLSLICTPQKPGHKAIWRAGLIFGLCTLIGAGFVGLVRPYALQLCVVALPVTLLPALLWRETRWRAALGMLAIVPLFAMSQYLTALSLDTSNSLLSQAEQASRAEAGAAADQAFVDEINDQLSPKVRDWQWQASPAVPVQIEARVQALATTRATLLKSPVYLAESTFERDVVPDTTLGVLLYLPRALQIGLFAPFPTTWTAEMSLFRLVGIAELSLWLLCVPGLFLLLARTRHPGPWALIAFAGFFITINAFAVPNLGSLHRIRYPFLLLMSLAGLAGYIGLAHPWLVRFLRWIQPSETGDALFHPQPSTTDTPPTGTQVTASRSRILLRSAMIFMLTAVTFALSFLRDVIISRLYGLGIELDAFYLTMALPMFLVAMLSIPLGSAFVPHYLQTLKDRGAQAASALTGALSGVALLGALAISALLILLGPVLLGTLQSETARESADLIRSLLPFATMIFLLSATVIIANSALNAQQQVLVPAIAQMAVPVIAILFIAVASDGFGILAVSIGMVIGQAINLIWVVLAAQRIGVAVRPKWAPAAIADPKSFLQLYGSLVVTAFLLGSVVLIDTLMAAGLPEGSVSAYTLGMKIALFFTGLIGAGLTVVLLPHFSRLVAQGRARHPATLQELSFYMMLTTLACCAFTLGFLYIAHPLMAFLFSGGAVSDDAVQTISQVAQLGMMQLPFFAVHALLVKFLNAQKKNRAVLISSVLNVGLNITLNLALIGPLGVAGLALATSLSMAASALVLVAMTGPYTLDRLIEMGILVALWGLFLTAILSYWADSTVGVAVAVVSGGGVAGFFALWRRQTRDDVPI